MAKSGSFGLSVGWQGGTAEVRWRSSTNSADNESTVTVEVWAHTSGFTTYGNGSWSIRIGNDGSAGGSVSIGSGWTRVASRSRTVTHGADGKLSISIGVVSGGVAGTSWSSTSGLRTVALDDFSRLPGKPGTPTVSDILPTSAKFAWSAASSPVSVSRYEWLLELANGTDVKSGNTGTSRTLTLTGLDPATKYTLRVRAVSSEGTGDYSSTRAFETLAGGRVKNAGAWGDSIPWVKVNGTWVRCRPYEKQSGAWKAVR